MNSFLKGITENILQKRFCVHTYPHLKIHVMANLKTQASFQVFIKVPLNTVIQIRCAYSK